MWALSAATLVLVAVALRDRMAAVGDAGALPGPFPLLLAVAGNLAATFVMTDAWRKVVAIAAPEPPWRISLWVWAASQLSRYALSGAQVVGRAAVAARNGIALLPAGAAAIVEVGWQLAVAAAIALALVTTWLPAGGELDWLAWSALVPVAGLVALHVAPRKVVATAGRAIATLPWGRTRRIGAALSDLALTRRAVVALTLRYLLNTALRTAAFVVLFDAVGGGIDGRLELATGAYLAGQIVGRLAVFAPGGIGPREGVTALVLAPSLGGGPALLLVAAVRLVEIAAEIAFVASAGWLARGHRTAPDR